MRDRQGACAQEGSTSKNGDRDIRVYLSISYRVDWCINHRLQSNQFVGRSVEEEDDEEEEENDGES